MENNGKNSQEPLEIRHLQKFTAFECARKDIMKLLASEASEKVERPDNFSWSGDEKQTPSQHMLTLLAEASDTIKEAINSDLKMLGTCESPPGPKNATTTEDKAYQKELFFRFINQQIILRARSEIYVQRIGDLRKRLAQEMDHINPDLQSPTIRRRREYGFLDNYLKKLCNWAHRDIINLAKGFGARYPLSEVPVTIQYWQYDYTSRNFAFCADSADKAWKNWFYSADKPESIKVKQTVFIQASYWMLDRACYHPIIGHELGHRVLRDSLGSLNVIGLQRSGSDDLLARLARRIVDALEVYLNPGEQYDHPGTKLGEEILCDCLAASRFGHAYLYAWFLEILSNNEYNRSELFQDEFRYYMTDNMDKEAGPVGKDISGAPPEMYLRGRALLYWLKDISHTQLEKELGDAVEQYLNLWIKNILHEDHLRYWTELGACLERAIEGSGVLKSAASFRDGLDSVETVPSNFSDTWFANIQGLANTTRESFVASLGTNKDDCSLSEAASVPWQAEWLLYRKKQEPEEPEEKEQKEQKEQKEPEKVEKVDSASMRGTKLFMIAAEDYMLRTGNPQKLCMMYDIKGKESHSSKLIINQGKHFNKWEDARNQYLTKDGCKPPGQGQSLLRCSSKDGKSKLHGGYDLNKILVFTQRNCGSYADVYSMSLMSIRAEEELGDRLLVEQWKAVAPDKLHKCKVPKPQRLLGRYDGYSLEKLHDNPQTGWSFHCKGAEDAPYPPYSTRRKLLLELGLKNEEQSKKENEETLPILMILVELKAPLFRQLFLTWLEHYRSQNERQLIQRIFLSYGWEDIVLFLGEDKPRGVSQKHFDFLTKIYDHPMVNRTESLFTEQSFERELGPNISVVYNVRVKRNMKNKFEEDIKDIKKLKKWSVLNIECAHTTGRMDYHVCVKDDLNQEQIIVTIVSFRGELLKMESIERVETDIKFDLSD